MSDDLFSKIDSLIPEDDLPAGHIKRFNKKLDAFARSRSGLRIVQKIAIAASVAAFIALSGVVAFNLKGLKSQKTALTAISPEFHETEQYLTSEIEEKMEILEANHTLNKEILSDIKEIDKSCDEVKKELFKNPNDDRLISAVIETYQTKLELLDEIISKTCEYKI